MGTRRESNTFPASEDDRAAVMSDTQVNVDQRGQSTSEQQRQQYQALLQRVTERVWQLWLADLRHDQERRGQRRREK
jgi:hypothetical protein